MYLIIRKKEGDYIKLYEHQKKLLELLSIHNQYLVLDEQGTGKTLPLLIHISNLFMEEEIASCLIVAPKSAIGAWYRDMDKLKRRMPFFKNIEVLNYDKFSRKTSKYREQYAKGVDCLILDEGHAIKNRTSNRTKYFIGSNRGRKWIEGLNTQSKYRYILTGTPIANGKLQEYWSLMEFINPGGLGKYQHFESKYCITVPLPGSFVKMVVGYDKYNKQELLDYVSSYACRRFKKDCLDLPEKMPDEIVFVDNLEPKIYKEAEKEMVVEIFESTIATPLTLTGKLRQICSGFYKDEYGETHDLRTEKPKILEELIDSIGKKVVIFYEFTHSCDVIETLLKKKKMKYVILNGNQKNKLIWREFQSDDTIDAIVVQFRSGESGIDLYAASHTIYYEPPQSTTTLGQSRDRTHRIGVSEACNYYFLITKGTYEEKSYDRLAKGMECNMEYLREIARERR